jgi:hypothetical protein
VATLCTSLVIKQAMRTARSPCGRSELMTELSPRHPAGKPDNAGLVVEFPAGPLSTK